MTEFLTTLGANVIGAIIGIPLGILLYNLIFRNRGKRK